MNIIVESRRNLTFPGVHGSLENYMTVMRALCGDTAGKSMIDLGCCFAPNTPKLGFTARNYVDVIDRKLDDSQEQKFFYQKNILDVSVFDDGIFDVAIASDVIEHFLFEDGQKLLQIMENISDKQIIFTPTTALFGLAEIEDHDPEAHRSLWDPDWFEARGWWTVVFPDFHPSWNSGAFFAWRTRQIVDDFSRVRDILVKNIWE